MQIGTAKYGIRDKDGAFSPERAKEIAKVVKAFEIKLSQGAKPGKGGVLPGGKVTPEIAAIRGIPQGRTRSAPTATATPRTWASCSTRSPISARSPGAPSASRRRSAAGSS
jgi:glutamate synthase domain-containing protein 2